MAGRGRAATLPAWATSGDTQLLAQYSSANNLHQTVQPSQAAQPGQYSERTGAEGLAVGISSSVSEDRQTLRRDRSRSRDRSSGRSGGAQGDRASGQYIWVSRKKRGCVSNFDVQAPGGYELPPIAVVTNVMGVPNSALSFMNPSSESRSTQARSGVQQGHALAGPQADQQTKHARKLYAGGIPMNVTEYELEQFFNAMISRALSPAGVPGGGPPVLKTHLNSEKCYAFIELPTVELATACMELDGLKYDHHSGPVMIRIRRPKDYRPDTLPPPGPIPTMNLAAVGLAAKAMQPTSNSGGPSKIFIGGLPYNLADEQVTELLGAFGPIKAFNQVREAGTMLTKGYAFCEYVHVEHAEQAVAGLNGMKLGEKTLTVRPSIPSSGGASGGAGHHVTQQLQQQQQQQYQYQQPGQYQQQPVSGVGYGNGVSSNPLLGALSGGVGGGSVAPALGASAANPLMVGLGLGGGAGSVVAAAPALGSYGNMALGTAQGMQQQQQQQQHFPPPLSIAHLVPSRVLLLTNMVTSEEIQDNGEYEDIKEDVRLECSDHGAVLRVLIPRECDGYMRRLEGSIFVEFADAGGARAAALALNGRKFADKTVVVQYFDESKFTSGNL